VTPYINPEETKEFLRRGFSRRHFGRIATMLTAGATLPFYNEPALAQLSKLDGPIPADAVIINANENPMGPHADAIDAVRNISLKSGRYMYNLATEMQDTLADQLGVKHNYVRAAAGSSNPLHHCVMAFCSPQKGYVVANPGYEAGGRAAEFIGSKSYNVPLTKDYAHDVKAMAKADPNAGLLYLCNPNNPSGTLTSRADMEWLLKNKPAGSILLVDEAYIHISPNAVSMADMVAQDKDIVVLRTFSKLYGMAGLRAAAIIARPDLQDKIARFTAGALPVTSMVAATASLKVKNLVPERRQKIKEIREDVLAWCDKHNFKYVPSESNKFMLDTKRPGNDVIAAMRNEKVLIGRVWPIMPTYVRITIGTKDEMEKFKAAYLKVMA
jgi:histidinol-phosphate aminotransferase